MRAFSHRPNFTNPSPKPDYNPIFGQRLWEPKAHSPQSSSCWLKPLAQRATTHESQGCFHFRPQELSGSTHRSFTSPTLSASLKALTLGTSFLQIEAGDPSHLLSENFHLKSNGQFRFNPRTFTGQTKGSLSPFPASAIGYLPHPTRHLDF